MNQSLTKKATLFTNNNLIQVRLQEQTGQRAYKDLVKRVTLNKTDKLNVRTLIEYDRKDKQLDSKHDQLSKKISRKLHSTSDLYTAATGNYFIALDATTAQVLFADINTHEIEIACVTCVDKNKIGEVHNGDAKNVHGKLKETSTLLINDELSFDAIVQNACDTFSRSKDEILSIIKNNNEGQEVLESKPKRIPVEASLTLNWQVEEIELIVEENEIEALFENDPEVDQQRIDKMISSLAINYNRDLLKTIKPLVKPEHVEYIEDLVKLLDKGMRLLPDRFTIEKITQFYPLMFCNENFQQTEDIITEEEYRLASAALAEKNWSEEEAQFEMLEEQIEP
ncbi:hypothetical protein K08M3_14270 [Vibrio alginolyticus]|uniref:Uncharacterized protein n=1 Tax=Vibrio alginolyticus TaxID=663 RepID=A0A1W6UZK3_VIBAL|nr:hypothetical protein [Vibrio alginolyticus]ARO98367.1 hypothetical protein K01M1_14240 [Vibrio alginolyticus]ARP03084.1 hypothetical protein K04M1_14360 [Vibrio alginolyticus]ARP08142.1 hypothetical protein K04M3_14390 [Vibrio alginolyticus]ARP13204.1 hypothetical protein K04M5_14040 [Vibrio alginolyticus]ARP18264.1 hypothetical protein K05K4_14280 [Vibrio alginolyticus]